jgi:hypothetical protein
MTDNPIKTLKELREEIGAIYDLLDAEIKARFKCASLNEIDCAGKSRIYPLLSVPRNMLAKPLETIDQAIKLLEAKEVYGQSEAMNALQPLRDVNEQLEKRLEIDPRHNYDGIDARDETIRGLEKKLEARQVNVEGLIINKKIGKMQPDKVYVLEEDLLRIAGERDQYHRELSDLRAKEQVDVKKLYCPYNTENETSVSNFYADGWNECIDHLISQGILTEKKET